MKIIDLLRIFFLSVLTISLSGCFDKPDEFVAPIWDTEINIPLTKKQFELLELVEKDSSLLKSFDDPEMLGLIYFGDTQSVSTIKIEDELKISPFETNFSQSIGQIKVTVPLPAASEIRVEDWTTDVTSGSYQIFPEQEGNVDIPVSGIETVESIIADEGDLTVFIWNNLPVELQLRGFSLQNTSDLSVIAARPGSNPSDWVMIPAGQFISLTYPVDGKEITNALQFLAVLHSDGSNGDSVQIPFEAGTTVLALFENLVIGAATAQLPVQNFQFNNSIMLDDSTSIEEALISEGSANLVVNNNMDVDLTTRVLFDNLFDASGDNYELILHLLRNEKNRIVQIPTLKDWRISSGTPGVTTNQISYSIEVNTDSTGVVSTLHKDDSVSFNLNFDELLFESFSGKLKPTNILLEESGFSLDYGDFNDQLQFGKINFQNAALKLNLESSSDMSIIISGDLMATNGLLTNNKIIQDVLLPSSETVSVNITDLINGFSSELPDSFSLAGSALLNPYYQLATVTRGDSIFGDIEFEIPLDVGIASGSFQDTLEIDLGNVDPDDIDRLNYGEVTFSIENTIPVGLSFTSIVLDSSGTPVLNIPAAYNDISQLEIPKPVTSENGELLSSGQAEQTISLLGDDIKKLLNSPNLIINVKFDTAGKNNSPVKFKTSNSISFEINVKAEYRVDL